MEGAPCRFTVHDSKRCNHHDPKTDHAAARGRAALCPGLSVVHGLRPPSGTHS